MVEVRGGSVLGYGKGHLLQDGLIDVLCGSARKVCVDDVPQMLLSKVLLKFCWIALGRIGEARCVESFQILTWCWWRKQ